MGWELEWDWVRTLISGKQKIEWTYYRIIRENHQLRNKFEFRWLRKKYLITIIIKTRIKLNKKIRYCIIYSMRKLLSEYYGNIIGASQ